jgi:hypothetical protein
VALALAVLALAAVTGARLLAPGAWTAEWIGARGVWNAPLLAYAAATAGCALLARLAGRWTEERRRLAGLALLGVLALALASRWHELEAVVYRSLDPDARGVAWRAGAMWHPYNTNYREPAWVWGVRLAWALFGPSDLHVRYFSLIVSLVLLWAVYRFVARLTGDLALALATTGLLAVNPYLAALGVRGLRIELYTLALVLVCHYALVPGIPARARSVGLATWTALGALTQLTSLVATVPLIAWAVRRRRLPWHGLAAALALTALAIGPHLGINAIRAGDPFLAVNVHGTWYRNYEYVTVRGAGCDGCPTLAERQATRARGRPVSMARYIFGMHSPREVAARILDGYATAFLKPDRLLALALGFDGLWAWLAYLVGLALLAWSPWREVLLLPLLSLNFLAFVVPLGIDPRLVMHTAPVTALALALALCQGCRLAWAGARRLARPWRPAPA